LEKAIVANATLALAAGIFEVEQEDDTVIVVPVVDLRELDYQRIEAEASEILELLNGPGIKNVILDFGKTDYYNCTALGFFLKLWKKVRGRNGRMAFCNVSDTSRKSSRSRTSPTRGQSARRGARRCRRSEYYVGMKVAQNS
jgi:anti-anti-sigma factor